VSSTRLIPLLLWMSGSLFFFSANAVAVRALAPTFSAFEMLAFRNGIGVVLLVAAALARPILRPEIVPRRSALHLARNLVHFAGTYAWTLGVTLLPLATVFALEFTSPAWTALLAVVFLGERLTTGRLVAIVLGFLGVLVILRPGLTVLKPESAVVLFAALAFAATAVMTKRLTASQSTYTILLWMNLIQGPLNLIGASEAFWEKLAIVHALPVAAMGVSGLFAHLCLTNAYRHGDATMVVPLDFLRVPLIALVGWQLFGEALDPFVLLGSLCIIVGVLWNLRQETRQGMRQEARRGTT
jgi:drug/metabolite transporter (DMT)-like permease